MVEQETNPKTIRPRINADFPNKIRVKYWEETKNLNDEQTITWALKRFLQFEESVKETLGAT